MNKLTETIYNYISGNCVGKENAVSAKKLCCKFDLIVHTEFGIKTDDRELRRRINRIRNDKSVEVVIGSCDKGYFACRKEDVRKANGRLYSAAFDLLRTARANEKKAGLNGQGEFEFLTNMHSFVKSLAE